MKPTIMDILGQSTPVSEALAGELGYVRAAIACRVFFTQQLQDHVCRLTIATFAKKLGMGAGTVSANLKWLRENGWIESVEGHKSGNAPNKYIVADKFFETLNIREPNDNIHLPNDNIHLPNVATPENIREPNGEEVKKDFQKKSGLNGKRNNGVPTLAQTAAEYAPDGNDAFWSSVKASLRGSMTTAAYAAYIAPTSIISWRDGVLEIDAASESNRQWLERRLTRVVEQAAGDAAEANGLPFLGVTFAVAQK